MSINEISVLFGTVLVAWSAGIWAITEGVSGRVKSMPAGQHILPWLPIAIGAVSGLVVVPVAFGANEMPMIHWAQQLLIGAAAGAFACKIHEEKNRTKQTAEDTDDQGAQ